MEEEKLLSGQTPILEKRAYAKPIISQIRLVAQEAVLGTCKLGTGAGVQSTCQMHGDLSCRGSEASS